MSEHDVSLVEQGRNILVREHCEEIASYRRRLEERHIEALASDSFIERWRTRRLIRRKVREYKESLCPTKANY